MFISRVYRPGGKKWPWYTLVVIEGPLTVALLALFGIADPNTYRTKLRQDGADNGFNSSPSRAIYAAANYQPYTTPGVWSQFITSYNIVISVLSVFILIAKIPMFILHVWPPLLSAFAHGALLALYAVSIYYQTGSDTSDPRHPQNGPPWYITKPCSVAAHPSNIGYCQQAKSAFACTVIAFSIFSIHTLWSLFSLYPSRTTREMHSEKSLRAKSAYSEAAALTPAPSTAHRGFFSSLKSPSAFNKSDTSSAGSPDPNTSTLGGSETWGREATTAAEQRQQQTATSGRGAVGFAALTPMTPRTQAFNRLGGTRDLPLRNHFSSPNAPRSPTFGVKSPLSPSFAFAEDPEKGLTSSTTATAHGAVPPHAISGLESGRNTPNVGVAVGGAGGGDVGNRGRGPMYFPPPPKVAVKGKK